VEHYTQILWKLTMSATSYFGFTIAYQFVSI